MEKRQEMKVLIMNPILYTSETDQIPKVSSIKDTMIYTMCKGFIENGDEPVLVAADVYRPTENEKYPFPVIWLSCRLPRICKPRCLPWLKGLSTYLKKYGNEFDYIISSEAFSLLTLDGVIHVRRKMIIWHELGAHNNILCKIPSKIWYNIVVRGFMKDVPVVPRSDRAAQFIRNYSKNVLDIQIDHGIDLTRFTAQRKKKDIFVVISQLIERKHIDKVIEKFSEFVNKNHKGYLLYIIGTGIKEENLKKQTLELDMNDNIVFKGRMNHTELVPVLREAKALLINTSKDNSMVSIVESIACGTPIITTTVPFNASYIKKEMLGIVNDNWDEKELEEMCKNNEKYVDNCIQYREKLGNVYLARKFNQVGGMLNNK